MKKKINIVGVTTEAGKEIIEKKEYDRILASTSNPKLSRVNFDVLNGKYRFEVDKSEITPLTFSRYILVPFPVGSILSGYTDEIDPKNHYHYHLDFNLDSQKVKTHERVFLVFYKLSGNYKIRINSSLVHEGIDGNNIRIDIKDHLYESNNKLDIDFTKSDSEFLGITAQVNVEYTGFNDIKDVRTTVNMRDETVTFNIVSDDPNGYISLMTPQGSQYQYTFSSNKVVITLPVTVPWTPKEPYMYTYVVENNDDKVFGSFAYVCYNISTYKGIPCLLLNRRPYPIKGILDNYFYPDGLTTMPSYEHSDNMLTYIKQLGFNSINVTSRVEIPYFYSNCESRGLLTVVNLNTSQNLDKEVYYLTKYDSNFLFIINNETKEDNVDLYNKYKKYTINKLLVIKKKNKTYGDIDLIENVKDLKKIRLDNQSRAYILTNFDYGEKINNSDKFMEFIDNNDYYNYSSKGLIGFFYSNYNSTYNGIFRLDKFQLNENGIKVKSILDKINKR